MVNMIVLTSGASSGKSTTINDLKSRRYCIFRETATPVLRQYPHWEYGPKQIEIFRRQRIAEESWCKDEPLFMDRSLIDCYTYTDLFVKPWPKEIFETSLTQRYSKVFVLEPLPYIQNDVRIEKDEKEALAIHKRLVEDYKARRYNPINVPVMSIEERTDFILKRCGLPRFNRG